MAQGIIVNTAPDDARCVALYGAVVAQFDGLTFKAVTIYLDPNGNPAIRVTF